jgi:hypothetical protein
MEQLRWSASRPQVQLYSFPTLFSSLVFIIHPLNHQYKTTASKSDPFLPSQPHILLFAPQFQPPFLTFRQRQSALTVTNMHIHLFQNHSCQVRCLVTDTVFRLPPCLSRKVSSWNPVCSPFFFLSCVFLPFSLLGTCICGTAVHCLCQQHISSVSLFPLFSLLFCMTFPYLAALCMYCDAIYLNLVAPSFLLNNLKV